MRVVNIIQEVLRTFLHMGVTAFIFVLMLRWLITRFFSFRIFYQGNLYARLSRIYFIDFVQAVIFSVHSRDIHNLLNSSATNGYEGWQQAGQLAPMAK